MVFCALCNFFPRDQNMAWRLRDQVFRWARGLLAIGLCLPCPGGAAADDIWVVAHQAAAVDALSPARARALFLGAAADPALVPVDREDRQLRSRFYRALFDMSLHSIRAYWAKQVFTGRGRPPRKLASEQMPTLFSEPTHFVTYVAQGRLPPNAKVLLELDGGNTE